MNEKTPFPLSKPIKAHGEEVHELLLRDANALDARVIGELPYWITDEQTVRLNTAVAMKYLSRLAAVPASSIDQLSMTDLNALCWKVAGFFFGPGQQPSTSSSDSSTTLPTSGE